MSENKKLNLTKHTLPELQELLQRQKNLLKNKSMLQNLQDKGKSIDQLHNNIEKEIKHRDAVKGLQNSLSALSIDINPTTLQAKHIQYILKKDKPVQDIKYKPHKTLLHNRSSTSSEIVHNHSEITSAFEPKLIYEPTRYIPLSESLDIQSEQAQKLTEIRAKRMFEGLNYCEVENSDSDEHNALDDNL